MIKRIKKVSFLTGEFKLRSGQTSNYYWDKYQFISSPEINWHVIDEMCNILPSFPSFDKLAGLELGGTLLAKDISSHLYYFRHCVKPSLFVRKQAKEHGTCNLIEGGFKPGDRVVVVEDIVTTAGQIVKSIQQMEESGLFIAGVVCVIDRQQGGRVRIENLGYDFGSVFVQKELEQG